MTEDDYRELYGGYAEMDADFSGFDEDEEHRR